MKNHKLFGAIVGSVIALTISSCGKEDKIERFPEGTSMIKMMDEDNGGTTLGNSNVYFLLGSPLERGQMPEMDSDLGTLAFDLVSHKSNSISVKLPSEDIEVIINDKTPLTCSTKGKTLTLTLTSAPMSYETGTWPLSIRSGRVYTKATVAIE